MDFVQLAQLLINFISIFSKIVYYAILARVLLSWFQMGQMRAKSRFEQIISDITDPFVNFARKLPHRVGMLDFAPIIAMLLVDFGAQFLILLIIKLV